MITKEGRDSKESGSVNWESSSKSKMLACYTTILDSDEHGTEAATIVTYYFWLIVLHGTKRQNYGMF